jgi:hypothetical protein
MITGNAQPTPAVLALPIEPIFLNLGFYQRPQVTVISAASGAWHELADGIR